MAEIKNWTLSTLTRGMPKWRPGPFFTFPLFSWSLLQKSRFGTARGEVAKLCCRVSQQKFSSRIAEEEKKTKTKENKKEVQEDQEEEDDDDRDDNKEEDTTKCALHFGFPPALSWCIFNAPSYLCGTGSRGPCVDTRGEGAKSKKEGWWWSIISLLYAPSGGRGVHVHGTCVDAVANELNELCVLSPVGLCCRQWATKVVLFLRTKFESM